MDTTQVPALLSALGGAAAKGTLILAVAAALSVAMRRRSAAARHALWTGALAAQLLMLLASPFLPPIPLAVVPEGMQAMLGVRSTDALPAVDAPADVIEGDVAELQPTSPAPATAESSPARLPTFDFSTPVADAPVALTPPAGAATAPAASSAGTFQLDAAIALLVLWLAGVLLLVTRHALGTARVARLARTSDRVEDGSWLSLAQHIAKRLQITRPLTILRGNDLDVPVTWGVVYPVVLLPAAADEWPVERRRVVLLHEMAHVKRFDAMTQLVGQLCCTLFWFNPLAWLAVRRMRVEREHACDDYVLRDGTVASSYADELLCIVRSIDPAREATPAYAALAMARRGDFEERMLAILDPRTDRHALGARGAWALVATSLLLALPLAAVRPAAAEAAAARIVITDPGAERARDSHPRRAARAEDRAAEQATVGGEGIAGVTAASIVAATRDTAGRSRGGMPQRGASHDEVARPGSTVAAGMGGPLATQFAGAAVGSAAEWMRADGGTALYYKCSRASLHTYNGNVLVHTDTDRSGRSTREYTSSNNNRCVHSVIVGEVRFSDDLRRVTYVGESSRAYLQEMTPGVDRVLTVERAAGGEPRRRYSVNGRDAAFGEDGEDWLARLLREMVREGGFNTKERVAQLRASGGVDAVLNEVNEIGSSSAKARYLKELAISQPPLSRAEVDRVVRLAGETVRSSSDLRTILLGALATGRVSPSVAVNAIRSMSSSSDKRAVLQRLIREPMDAATTEALLVATRDLSSSSDMASVLVQAAQHASSTHRGIRGAFFAAANAVPSSSDHRRVLAAVIKSAETSRAEVANEVIRSAQKIESSTDKSSVLVALARKEAELLRGSASIRQAFVKAVDTIGSESDRARVLRALEP